MDFETYLQQLAKREEEKSGLLLTSPRDKILVSAGILLNWMGDFLANDEIKWELREVPVSEILFTGIQPDINEILLNKCDRDPTKLLTFLETDPQAKKLINEHASYDLLPIMLRKRDDGKYLVLDGMHRFIGIVLKEKDAAEAFVAQNDDKVLPNCEPHVIYDLIRGYQRHAQDEVGENAALRLLNRTYANVKPLLKERFNEKWVPNESVQKVIKEVLETSYE